MEKKLDELMKEIEKLSEEEKAELLKRLEEKKGRPAESGIEYRINDDPWIIKNKGGIR